jgi:ABC-type nitrate/sulfonate/bicarbonate transport system substrate-binding protein
MLQLPFSGVAVRSGMQLLLDYRKLDYPIVTGSMTASSGWVAQNEEVARRYVRSLVEAIHYLRSRRAESVAIMRKVFQLDDAAVLDDLYDEALQIIPPLPYPTRDALQNMLTAQAEDTPAVAGVTIDELYDDRFLRELEAEGIMQRLYGQ